MSTPQNDADPASRPVANDDLDTTEGCDAKENSRTTESPPPLARNTMEGDGDAPEQGKNVTVLRGTHVQASEAAGLGLGVDPEMDAGGEAPAASKHLVCLDSTSLEPVSFQESVAAWAQSAVAVLETTTDSRRRIAVRDEAVRVAALAAAAGAGVAVALAHEVLQRAVRSIGKRTPRRRAGRPPSTASDEPAPRPVRGDTTLVSEPTDDGLRPPPGRIRSPDGTISADRSTLAVGDEAAPRPVHGGTTSASEPTDGGLRPPPGRIRSPDGTISVDGPRSTTRDLPRATRSAYRQDAEAVTDPGFERIGASVRAAAAADPAAGHRLGRGLVRAAGAVEAAGGDPGDLQAVEAKKQELSDSRKRSPVHDASDSLPPCYVPPRIIEVVRQILGGQIDLDPASTEAQNRYARARVFYDGTDASWPGLKAAWPKNARVWVHVPRGADAAAFVQRVLTHAEAGAPVVVLTDNRTHMPWAQSLLAAAASVCFAGDTTVQRPRTDDPSVVEVEEAPLATPQGHILVGLNVDRTAFEKSCAGLGVSFVRGTDQGVHAGILSPLRFLPFGRKTTMPAS